MKGIQLRLAMPAEWDRVDSVRQAVAFCVQAVFGDEDLREALAMVAAELLENAVKYGKPESPVELNVDETPELITIRVTNRLANGADSAKPLLERVAWVKSFENPLAAYMAALENTYGDEEGGLGLVRIAHEGGCLVDCQLGDDNVTVVARSQRQGPS
jgi:hypothetical protein